MSGLSVLVYVDYRCHVYVRSDYLSCVVIADQDYPARVAHTLMNKVCVMGYRIYRGSEFQGLLTLSLLNLYDGH